MEMGFLMVSRQGGGAVMGGAAGTGLRGVTVSRAAHQALRTDVERHGIRADRYCRMSISTRRSQNRPL
ncbi:hypothetical protein DDE05_15910, partial [Streptomyces cavourensis]